MSEDKRHSDVVHVPPGGGRTVWLYGEPIKFYALGEDTGGAFTLFEQNVPPREGSLPHKHRHEDQAFFALEGDFEFVCDGRAFVAEAGSFVHVPRGTVHAFENVGSGPGRLMIFSIPAGETERFFFEVGEEAPDASSPPPTKDPPEIGELLAVMRRYDMEVDSFALLRQISAKPTSEQDHPG
jgi:quercetin dioxygenase-like cupin family protein